MDVLSLIYKLLIGPLELFFEVVFTIAYRFIGDAGFSIIFLSLAMNFLVLPLYRRADAMQEAERDRSTAMKPYVDHIKKTFTGDERFMMLQTYYRQIGYKQTDALKGSVSLLLEIPFFIAAYHFLSNLPLLRGVPFGPIADLGAPDALLVIGDVTINVLPILMTLINFVAAAIYMKGFPLKSKVQMYGVAIIFLVLLYASPAGLVFYWTLNNLFSLVKNIFYKLKNPKLVLSVLASIVGVALIVLAVAHPLSTATKQAFVIGCAVLLQLPLVSRAFADRLPKLEIPDATKREDRMFLLACLFMALLCGLLIPCSVIQSSPSEFVDTTAYRSPLWYVIEAFMLAAGMFVVWFQVFYRLATPRGKTIFCVLMWVVAGVAIVNYLLFGTDFGTLSPMLQYDTAPVITVRDIAVNLAAIAVTVAVLLLIWKRKRAVVGVALGCLCIAVGAMSVIGMVSVHNDLAPVRAAIAETDQNDTPHFTLSKNGKNVVVIMMDRALSYYLPFLMNEKPELAEGLRGFTYYPNAVSFGSHTNVGTPGLYGGYEYTPEKMNERADQSLREKQNEALKLMPVLFSENGFDTTVFDPTYAGYRVYPDLSIYNNYPDIHKYVTMDGQFVNGQFGIEIDSSQRDVLMPRNFFCYSLFKTAPLVVQPTIYEDGNYNSAIALSEHAAEMGQGLTGKQTRDGVSRATGVDETFIKSYAVLDSLLEITEISDDASGGFLMMSNDTTHEPMTLKEPEYVPEAQVDNTEYDLAHLKRYAADGRFIDLSGDVSDEDSSKTLHYEVNMAALLKLCDWLNYLRENGVYDNTRIIVVSDHGRDIGLDENMVLDLSDTGDGAGGAGGAGNASGDASTSTGANAGHPDGGDTWDMMMFNCMLMVKDFGSDEFKVDERFMTNADTPTLALEGVVDNPVNPFTGNPVNNDAKSSDEHHLLWATEFSIRVNDGNTFLPGNWFSVGNNIFDHDNWSYLGNY